MMLRHPIPSRFIAVLTLCYALTAANSNGGDLAGSANEKASSARSKAIERYALTHAGDAKQGKKLFNQKQTTRCRVCHTVGGDGGEVGPDLTRIGGKFDRPHLIESLLYPSAQLVEGYRTSAIMTSDGRVFTGVLKQRGEETITLADGDGKLQTIERSKVQAIRESDVSMMPTGLADQLSPKQFTDLIAYLETLRPGGKARFGSGVAGPIELSDDYHVQLVATGLDGATALETLPDGRVLICEQPGRVRVVKDGRLLEEPFVKLPVDNRWERGVIGVTIDPDFPAKPFVYVCWVAKDPYPHHRISRFRANGDVASKDSEEVLLVGDDQTKMGGKVPSGHQGGALHFGSDGCLYVGIGEQTAGKPAQSLDTFLGKILRIEADGAIPSDNPFVDQAEGKYRAIWAIGCRNPFTFAFRSSDGRMLINDVGGKFEEINPGEAGANYGWPKVDHGPREEASGESFVGPIHWYPQASIAGGDFAPEVKAVDPTLRGDYFFADFVNGWIKTFDPERPDEVTTFADGLRRPVDLRFASDGSLYVLLRNAWVVDDKFEGGTGSLLRISPASAVAAESGRANHDYEMPSEASPGVIFEENAVDASAGGLPAYQIQTPNATYLLEKSGAGLSSLIDKDGNDWLSFAPTAGSGSAGEYRGFPNAVHQQGGNFFHAMNEATDHSETWVISEKSDHVSIGAISGNSQWECRYDFYPSSMTFTMTRMPTERRYWILYEGTPGGSYDDADWWMTSGTKRPQSMETPHNGDINAPEWIAFGDAEASQQRSLLLLHHQDDDHPDRFYQMRHQMTVFGFGRKGIEKHLQTVPQSVTISFVESTERDDLRRRAEKLLARPLPN